MRPPRSLVVPRTYGTAEFYKLHTRTLTFPAHLVSMISSWCAVAVFSLSLFTVASSGSISHSGKRIAMSTQDRFNAGNTGRRSGVNTGCLLTLKTTIASDALRERLLEFAMADDRLRSSLVFPLVNGTASADQPPYFQRIDDDAFRVPLDVAEPLIAAKGALNQAVAQAMADFKPVSQQDTKWTLCFGNLWRATYWPGRSASHPSHLLLIFDHVLTDGLGQMRFIEKHLLQDIGLHQPLSPHGPTAQPLEDASFNLVKQFPTLRRDGISERSISLDDIRTVRQRFNTTVTDIMIACAGEAITQFIHSELSLKDMRAETSATIHIPFNGRASDDSSLSNQVLSRRPRTEVSINPEHYVDERLRDVIRQNWKKPATQHAADLELLGNFRANIHRVSRHFPARKPNEPFTLNRALYLSNVPGPKKRKSLYGSEVESVHMIGHGGNDRGSMNVGSISYCGQLQISFSFHSDPFLEYSPVAADPLLAQRVVNAIIDAFYKLRFGAGFRKH